MTDIVQLPELTKIYRDETLLAMTGTLTVNQIDGTPGPATIYNSAGAIVNTTGAATWTGGESSSYVATGHIYAILDSAGGAHMFRAIESPGAPRTITGADDPTQAALRVQGAPSTHLLIVNRTGGNPSNGNALLVVGGDYGTDAAPMDTTIGFKGYELGKGTIKGTHMRPTKGVLNDDTNASVLSTRTNGPGTKAQAWFHDYEDGVAAIVKMVNLRVGGRERFVVNTEGDILVGNNLQEFFNRRRAAPIATVPDLLAQAALTLTPGAHYAAVADVFHDATLTTVRFATGGTAPAGLTDVRLCAWDLSGNVLAQTANIAAAITAGNQLIEQPFITPLVVAERDRIFLGVAWTGTTLNIRGAAGSSATTTARGTRTFAEARSVSGYAGGTVGNIASGATGIVPWVEAG